MRPDTQAVRWQSAVQNLLDIHRPEQAERLVRQQLSRNPEDAQAYVLLALSLIHQKLFIPAAAAARQALQLDVQEADAHHLLSVTQLHEGQSFAALNSIREALRLAPGNVQYLSWLAVVHNTRREYAEALQAAGTGLCYHATHLECLYQRLVALQKLQRWQEVAETLRQLTRFHPQAAIVHRLLAEEAERQQQPAAAETHYRETLRIQPAQPTPQAKLLALLLQRAQQALLQNQLEAARTAFLEVRHLDPDNEAALTGLVHIIKHNSFLHRLAFRWETYAEQAQSRAKCGNLVGIAQLFLVIVPVISFLCLPIIALYLYVGLYWRLHPDIRRIRNRPGLARPYAHQTLYRYGLPGSLCLLLLAILPGLIGTLAPFGATSMNALSGGLTPIILITADAFKKAAKGPLPENSPLKWLLLSAAVLVSSITCACWPATWPYGPLVSLAVTGGLLMYLFRQMHPRNPL